MDATMFQLRSFVHHRMYAAAEEILGEVEKTITLAMSEVSRPKEEAESLRRRTSFLQNKSADRLPLASSSLERGAECDPPALRENQSPSTQEGSSFSLSPDLPGPSKLKAGLHSSDWSYSWAETDFKMTDIKEEQVESGEESQTPSVAFLSAVSVKSEEDQTRASNEMQPVSTDDSSVHSESKLSDEELLSSKGEPFKTMRSNKFQRDKDGKNGRAALPRENRKSQKDRSFCHLCGKGFQYIGSLMKHIKLHESQTDCSFCGMTHQSTRELIIHLKRCHSKSNFCGDCGKAFINNRRLRLHRKIHAGIREFMCQECGKRFNRREHLIVHVRTHSGEKPYHCEICGKAFSQSQNLTIHKRSHSGEKPYQCGLCGKLFNTSSHLKTHMRYHSGEKPYPCDVCGKSFRQSGQMTRHRTTHTGERPYACHICGMRYRFAPNLRVHMESHEQAATE
ncbi:zinc finger protein 100-like [Mugil cephalus]|uniref:zinc finger protein 100-like n=1 Tax=Mugil cephalus TaxID=48193 RepID=UPI001FB59C74|nr:zinc finger protein 100-like [Mugil cephalus]